MLDNLLVVLSKRRSVTWSLFKDLLGRLDPALFERRSAILNVMVGLGHVVADFPHDEEGRVTVAPRVLARLPHPGRPRAVLAGHRTAETAQVLGDVCARFPGATLTVDSQAEAPKRLQVEADSSEDLAGIAGAAESLYHPDPAAWRVLQHIGRVDQYQYRDELRWMPGKDLNWDRRDFDVKAADLSLAGLFDPIRRCWTWWLRAGERTAEVERDWGRYAVLHAAGRRVLVRRDRSVAVPLAYLLPAGFATGLTLCSGRAPKLETIDGRQHLVYDDVPDSLADLAADKLGQAK